MTTTRWNLGVLFDTEELSLVYELLHDVKISHARRQATGDKVQLKTCNKIMEKIEQLLLAEVPENVETKSESKS